MQTVVQRIVVKTHQEYLEEARLEQIEKDKDKPDIVQQIQRAADRALAENQRKLDEWKANPLNFVQPEYTPLNTTSSDYLIFLMKQKQTAEDKIKAQQVLDQNVKAKLADHLDQLNKESNLKKEQNALIKEQQRLLGDKLFQQHELNRIRKQAEAEAQQYKQEMEAEQPVQQQFKAKQAKPAQTQQKQQEQQNLQPTQQQKQKNNVAQNEYYVQKEESKSQANLASKQQEEQNLKTEAENKAQQEASRLFVEEQLRQEDFRMRKEASEKQIQENFAKGQLKKAKDFIQQSQFQLALDVIKLAQGPEAIQTSFDCEIKLGLLKDARASFNQMNNKEDEKDLKDAEFAHKTIEKFQGIQEQDFSKVVYHSNEILKICTVSIQHVCFKIEGLLESRKAYEAAQFGNDRLKHLMKNIPEVMAWTGRSLICSGKNQEGLNLTREAIKLDPDNKLAKQILSNQKKYDKLKIEAHDLFSQKQYDKVDELDKQILDIDHCNLGEMAKIIYNKYVVKSLQEIDSLELIDLLNQSLQNNPDYVDAIQARADLYTKIEDYRAAVQDYQHAYKLNPSHENKEDLNDAQKSAESVKVDHYKTLNVKKDATAEQIKKQYRILVRQFHPDKNSSSTEAAKQEAERQTTLINEANEILSDQKKRADYDNSSSSFGIPRFNFKSNAYYYQ